ncbi:TPR domain protein [Oleispira antarctica RB-8]|uniref:TPR domain protein n=1 Tax=Oleispira antarctica RB-8 TaxID=698738 RepID=R4YMK6_OLEAN|nr:TPR domain protein [Oleispira antarctica RB-8]
MSRIFSVPHMLSILMLSFISSLGLMSFNAHAANQSLSPKTYQALNDIQALLTDSKFAEVEEGLKDLEENLSPGFGLALTYQIHAQLFLAQENSKQALSYFNKALALDAMKAGQAVSLATNVAQLYLADSQVDEAITVLQGRIEAAETEKVNSTNSMAFITLGSAFQLKQDFKNAIIWLRQGIERSKQPRENWLQMLMAAHYQIKQYPEAITVLDQLIAMNETKEEYWLQQASLHQMLNKPKDALKVLQLANVRNILIKEDGLIILVQLLITEGVPERAGRILQDLIEKKKIEITEDNWKLLASAWLQSRERKQAIDAFIDAAEFSLQTANNSLKESDQITGKQEAAKLYYRSAQLQFDESEFDAAASSFAKARELGLTGKKVGLSLLMQGNAYFELEEYQNAKVYFSKALEEPSSTNSAKAWLDYMQQLEVLKS